jgi:methionyl-tRNA formyltransferase
LSRDSYGLLVSGELGMTCLRAIYQKHPIFFVLTDKKSFAIISYCSDNNISVFTGTPRDGAAISFLNNYQVDTILSINYLFLIESDIINFPRKYAINFHGSLLPRYRGRTPHVWAIINNETETGITAHFISETYDSGDIVYQEKVQIDGKMTGSDLLASFSLSYPRIIDKVIALLESSSIDAKKQDESKATYFGKRSPIDGMINWYWQRERINNWVRALAKPYPGAFTYYRGKKIILHQISFSDFGFFDTDTDGLVLEGGEQPIIKTPNGAIQILLMETERPVTLEKGEILCKISE